MRELFSTKAGREHPLAWVVESLEAEPTFALRPMFGGRAVHLHGRFVLYLTLKKEPWRGVLVPTEREHQPALCADCPALAPHPVLGKWLYLSEAAPSFERDAAWLVRRIRARDPRIGIEAGGKRRKSAQGKPQSRKRG